MEKRKNEIALTIDEIVTAVSGKLLTSGGGACFTNIYVDSREVRSGGIFFALKGEKTDGHNFVMDAAERGAALCIIEKMTDKIEEVVSGKKCSVIITEDSLKALQSLAKYYRNKFSEIRILGITGSSGKTTTKEIAGKIISKLGSTVITKGNLNSEIGLPLSVFDIRPDHKYGVFEMGVNHEGEMDILVDILHPEAAVITNIGTAHIGIFGTREKIAEEKSKIFTKNKSIKKVFVCENDDYLEFLKEKAGALVSIYGMKTMLKELPEMKGMAGSEITLGKTEIQFPLPGKYNINNALAAAAAGSYFGASETMIKEGLESASALFGRNEIREYDGITVFCDCYNANPDSVAKVIEFAKDSGPSYGRTVFAMGSLLELGENSEKMHKKIGELLAESGASGVFLFGEEMFFAFKVLEQRKTVEKVYWSENFGNVKKEFSAFVKKGDFVVIKGSRGTAMERILDDGIGEKKGA